MTEAQQKFLKTEFFIFSWEAATEHNTIWESCKTSQEKVVFRNELKSFLEGLLYNYSATDEEHIQNILKLQTKTEELKNKLNFGTCQKLLNMMCKYYWCSGFIIEPVHLPIDRINLQNAEIKNVNWTKLESVEEYKNLIEQFKQNLKVESLAIWELENWSRRNYKETN